MGATGCDLVKKRGHTRSHPCFFVYFTTVTKDVDEERLM